MYHEDGDRAIRTGNTQLYTRAKLRAFLQVLEEANGLAYTYPIYFSFEYTETKPVCSVMPPPTDCRRHVEEKQLILDKWDRGDIPLLAVRAGVR